MRASLYPIQTQVDASFLNISLSPTLPVWNKGKLFFLEQRYLSMRHFFDSVLGHCAPDGSPFSCLKTVSGKIKILKDRAVKRE